MIYHYKHATRAPKNLATFFIYLITFDSSFLIKFKSLQLHYNNAALFIVQSLVFLKL